PRPQGDAAVVGGTVGTGSSSPAPRTTQPTSPSTNSPTITAANATAAGERPSRTPRTSARLRLADEVQRAAGAEPLDLGLAQRVARLEVDRRPVGPGDAA